MEDVNTPEFIVFLNAKCVTFLKRYTEVKLFLLYFYKILCIVRT